MNKKRILFVDDEPMVLQGIQRLLRPMREEWEMDFADGGEKAKECMGAAAYDVVVTDMMMPGMNGAQLLAHVKESTPKTIRLVLSGHAQQDLAIQCVGIAHQYLSKPCDAGLLKSTIARVTAPGFADRNGQVMTLVAQLGQLPSIPSAYSQIVEMLNSPDASLEEIGELIAGDMAMTAKILQIVNSAFFGLSSRISKPSEAASYLGMATIKALVLSTNVFCQYEQKMPKGFSATDAARHSQQVGALARAIARAEDAPRAVVDESLVAGLLHDVGKLILASSLPEQFERAIEAGAVDLPDEERAIFGASHADVGGYLLGLWGLPPPVVEAITLHHSPGESEGESFCPLTAVHVAECLLGAKSGGASAPAPDAAYLARLDLADRLPAWRAAMQELGL